MQLMQFASPAAVRAMPTRADDAEVTKAVRRYAHAIGCDASNTQAAIAWSLRSPGHTLQAIREGRRRAEQLRARQKPVPA
ncbi:TPA: hypothetical protein QEM98_000438 [Stenotrophomonas maltophilia]|nr:hypothetical protein [Stenotrophomonas maltophilia]